MGVDGARGDIDLEAPHVLQQHLAGLDAATTGHQRREQAKLERGERNRLVVDPDLMPLEVDAQAVELRLLDAGRLGCATTKDRPDPQEQLAHAKGLGHVVVGPELEADDAIDLLTARADHDDGDLAGPLGHPQRAAHLRARHVRQHPVEQHEVGDLVLAQDPQRRRAAVRRERGEALTLKAVAQRLDQVLLVVDQEDRARHLMNAPLRLSSGRSWSSRESSRRRCP